jgi:hypothetical protein
MWFDKKHKDTVYGDKRQEKHSYHSEKYGSRYWEISPDIVYDFISLPFKDEVFELVVFDPPHIQKLGESSFLAKKYGKLFTGWEEQLNAGFNECMRVLKQCGTLIFKWSEIDFTVGYLIKVLGQQPLFGNRSGKQLKTHWLTFTKNNP